MQQLYSLLSSLVKASVVFDAAASGASMQHRNAANQARYAAAAAAAKALTWSSSSSNGSGSGAVDAVSLLPSLVIVGRCCLQWMGGMQQQPPAMVAMMLRSTHAAMKNGLGVALFGTANPVGPLVSALEACKAWLQTPGVSAQLTAAGYHPQVIRLRMF